MATLSLNTPDAIEFKNVHADIPTKDSPFVIAQLGDWECGNHVESGIVVDAMGTDAYPAILSAQDARKLAKWLTRAADALDGAKTTAIKKNKRRPHYEEDDDQYKF